MTAFFESVRLDVQHRGVDVTIIQPGFIKTPLTSGRENKMPFIMELDDAIPLFINARSRRKKSSLPFHGSSRRSFEPAVFFRRGYTTGSQAVHDIASDLVWPRNTCKI